MSEVKGISTITDRAGTGAVDFSNGVNISGSDSGLSAFKHTEGATEPTSPSNGDTWWDTENEVYQIYVNDTWTTYIGASSSSAAWYGDRGLRFGGQINSSKSNTIEYIDISTPSNAADFGDLNNSLTHAASVSDATYGVVMGGYTNVSINNIDYITVATTGNAADFGDMIAAISYNTGMSDATYGVSAGGWTTTSVNTMEYITIATTGNATDFGDRSYSGYGHQATNDATRGVIGGNYTTVNADTIEYITIATASNATDFGDLIGASGYKAATGDATYGLWMGTDADQYQIHYVTIQTTGNSTDFGDLSNSTTSRSAACSNGTTGLHICGSAVDVEYITIATTGNASDFGDMLTVASYLPDAASGSPS